jgi:hypothetical protein
MATLALIQSRKIRLLLLFFSFALILVLASLLDGAYENIRFSSKVNLAITKELSLPIREISGLFLTSGEQGGTSSTLYAVGDSAATLGLVDFDGDNFSNHRSIDFSAPLLDRYAPCRSSEIHGCRHLVKGLTSQWEAVAVDGQARVYLLHEQFASIFVFDAAMTSVLGVINLSSFSPQNKHAGRQHHSLSKENALGEGFILLKNGHILLAKERFPPVLIEYGPEGSRAEGFSAAQVLGRKEAFALPGGHNTYVPLHHWYLAPQHRHCDLSELTVSAEGELHGISQQCRWIATFSPLSLSSDSATLAGIWHLPSRLTSVESLVVLDKRRFLVAEDRKTVAVPTLFILEKLDHQ